MTIGSNQNPIRASLIGVLSIIVCFVLIFLYIKPVIVGLLLSAIFLPLQQWIYNHFLAFSFVKKINSLKDSIYRIITYPLFFLTGKKKEVPQDKLHKQACTLTVLILIISIVLGVFFTTFLSTPYLKIAGGKISNVFQEGQQQDLVQKFSNYLSSKPYYEQIKKYIGQFYSYVEKNSFNWGKSFFLTGVGDTFSFIFQSFLTFFFFIFFLDKISFFQKNNSRNSTLGNYIVESFFNSPWTPSVNDNTKNDVKEIINNIATKLVIWVRGYSKIILVESLYYLICFYFLDVPYFFILAFLAGMTILLPFLGPLLSLAITLGVCFTVTGGLDTQLVIYIFSVYILMNLIIEQFILYPKFVGGALGLTAIETIVVVLIGGLVANILGAILAVPIASILKYLIQKFYKSLK